MLPRAAVAGGALALLGQFLFAACSSSVTSATVYRPVSYAPGARQYGVDGELSPKEYAVLHGLQWPQTLADMRGTFGSPAHFAGHEEFFSVESDPSIWVVISYRDKEAIGFYEVLKRD